MDPLSGRTSNRANGRLSTRQLTRLGLLTAVGLALALLERQLPPPAPVPGVRWGLANAATLAALALDGPGAGFAVWLCRFVLTQILAGTFFGPAFFVGGAGGLLAWAAMAPLSRGRRFGPAGVSAAGAVAHHVGQLAAAAVVTATPGVLFLLPLLLLLGPPVGLLTGLLVGFLLRRLQAAGVLETTGAVAHGAFDAPARGDEGVRGDVSAHAADGTRPRVRGDVAAPAAGGTRARARGDVAAPAAGGTRASARGDVRVRTAVGFEARRRFLLGLIRPADLLLAGGVAAAALLLVLGRTGWPATRATPTQAVVTVAGSTWRTLDLRQDGVYPLEPAGGHMVVEVAGGAVRVRESDCPDQVCVLTGWISLPGDMIVCVPYRVVIQVIGGTNDGPDAILR